MGPSAAFILSEAEGLWKINDEKHWLRGAVDGVMQLGYAEFYLPTPYHPWLLRNKVDLRG